MARAEMTVHLKDMPEFKELAARVEIAEAEVERLRTVTGMADEMGARITHERNEALAAIQRVRDMHQPLSGGSCLICRGIYPCRTIRALDQTGATDG